MVKYFVAVLRSLPAIISTFFACAYMRHHKDKFSFEVRFAKVKKLVVKVLKNLKVDFDISNKEHFNHNDGKGRLYIGNHNTFVDPFILIALTDKPLRFIVKKESRSKKFVSTFLRCIDTLYIDRNDVRQSLRICKKASDSIINGVSVVVYPEGTRSKTGEVLPFKAAFSTIVHFSKANTTMITLYNSKEILKYRWLRFPRVKVTGIVSDEITYQTYIEHKDIFADYTHSLMVNDLEKLKKEFVA